MALFILPGPVSKGRHPVPNRRPDQVLLQDLFRGEKVERSLWNLSQACIGRRALCGEGSRGLAQHLHQLFLLQHSQSKSTAKWILTASLETGTLLNAVANTERQ